MSTNITEAPVQAEQIEDIQFEVLIAETTPDPIHLCREYLLANEMKTIAEDRLETLKPLIEALRGEQKQFIVKGKFRNKMGKYKILHVGPFNKSTANVSVLKNFVERGILTRAQFNEAVETKPQEHNRVSWKASS